MHPTLALAATTAAPARGIHGMQFLGPVTFSALATLSTICLVAGLRGSDRVKMNNKEQALVWGFVTGTLWIGAGGTWADFGNSMGEVGKGLTTGTGFGDPGLGGSAAILLLIAWAWPWKKRMIWPALLGLAGAVLAGQAGGIPGIAVGIIRMIATKMSGG
ncbi:hypothetical protein ACWDBO_37155 [Streptomyces mirabilis]|uniref:hypothetical protein n=1 Tax=Streptomyces mirabilis TaxID=68239 RepID=UPI003322263F